MQDTLNVWFEGRLAGAITRRGKVHMSFVYAPEWLADKDGFALSLKLPLREEAFSEEQTLAFFNNLLPEEKAREDAGKLLHVSANNPFALLHELGAECAGALSIRPEGEPSPTPDRYEHRKIPKTELEHLIRRLPRRPLLAGEDGVRLSLAGAQAKLPVVTDGKTFLLPLNGAPSTYILKPPIDGLSESVENEAFCMFLAKAVGLSVPIIFITDTRPRAYVVERYDRAIQEGVVVRRHQEDFCQALGLPPELKYEREGGADLQDCFGLLDHCHDPLTDKIALFHWCIFNYLIGNADAHAKNLSLLYDVPPKPRLAPFYDLLCTAVYEELARKFSMKIGGQYDPEYIMGRHWKRLGKMAGWGEEMSMELVSTMASAVRKNVEDATNIFCKHYGESPIVRSICRFALKRCDLIFNLLAH